MNDSRKCNQTRITLFALALAAFMAVTQAEVLRIGSSAPVSVTFYEEPGMYASEGHGQCGYGSDVTGNTDFNRLSLYPLHVAAGNLEFLGGCGACGTLSYDGKARSYVVTDVTDVKDDLDRQGTAWPPYGSHIDMMGTEFDYFQTLPRNGDQLDFSKGGIFTGNWTRVPCETLGSPNYPDGPGGKYVVRTQAYNRYAKAVVVSRLHGIGEIKNVDFMTRNGAFHPGRKVDGWGAWYTPGRDLSGFGGVGLRITMIDDSVIELADYPLPDFMFWDTGSVFMVNP